MSHSVNLTWVASTDKVDGYNVYRGAAAGQEGAAPINSALITGTTYDDTAAVAGPNFYVVKASLSGVLSSASDEVSVTLPPAPPTALAIASAS